ncbi:hypothetical protein SNE40_000438 [Patella caerulea]|uniref:Superoxide dismutase copper/zinc binding domain-containing protein n=1 Tax=Patella caerulea TaxID=87958 RepID=A0AAN8KAJ4_PATCE
MMIGGIVSLVFLSMVIGSEAFLCGSVDETIKICNGKFNILKLFCCSEYQYAVCRVAPNPNLPVDGRKNINGNIFIKQLPGGPLEVDIQLNGFFDDGDDNTRNYCMRKYPFGNMTNGCESIGNGIPPRPCTEFGSLTVNDDGLVLKKFQDSGVDISRIIGGGVVIHSGDDESGNFGGRLACGVIESMK